MFYEFSRTELLIGEESLKKLKIQSGGFWSWRGRFFCCGGTS